MKTIKDIETGIIEDFEMFDDWMQKYEYLIDLGKELVPIEEKYKIEDNLIRGCQSRVWLHTEKQDEKIIYTADSDAIMTKGIIAILIRVLSNQTAAEIISADLSFIDAIGLKEQLSATRANGLVSMIKKMKLYALALKNKIPLIGVCRGMQMMNVASGGTLYGDIPTEIGTTVIHRNNGEVMHEIALSCNNPYYTNLIFPLFKDTFLVNSWHHQGLKDISPNLNVIARSYDGLPEAVVMNDSVHPFMIAVQFHPERLG